MGASECKGLCAPDDPTQDTVQVNPTLLQSDPYADETQCDSIGLSFKASRDLEAGTRDLEARAEEERRRRAEEERLRQAEEERLRLEPQMKNLFATQENIQCERAEAERLRQEKERVERELAERRQQAKQLERFEQERRTEEERQAREQQEAEEMVQIFLKANGFKGVNEKRKKACSSSYALHTAVAQNSVEIVQSLLRRGADPKLKNSAGKTPQQLAEKLNKKGTHDRVLQELQNS